VPPKGGFAASGDAERQLTAGLRLRRGFGNLLPDIDDAKPEPPEHRLRQQLELLHRRRALRDRFNDQDESLAHTAPFNQNGISSGSDFAVPQ